MSLKEKFNKAMGKAREYYSPAKRKKRLKDAIEEEKPKADLAEQKRKRNMWS